MSWSFTRTIAIQNHSKPCRTTGSPGGANASSSILLATLVEASAVARHSTYPLDGRIAAVVAAVPHDAVGPRPLPVHRYTVERVVKGRTRKVIEAELEVTSGPLLGSLTIGPFTSCPAGRSPLDRGGSLHRTGRGRIEENVIGYRRGGVRQLDSVAHCPLPNTKAR